VGTVDIGTPGFPLFRHYFLRISTQGQNRLTVSTFLAGLIFASFAALLTASQIPVDKAPSAEQSLQAAGTAVLSLATVLFLITAFSTYIALQHLADLSPSVAKALADGTEMPIPSEDAARLQSGYKIYSETTSLIPWGLVLVLVALPIIGWHTYVYIGVITIVLLVIVLMRSPGLRGEFAHALLRGSGRKLPDTWRRAVVWRNGPATSRFAALPPQRSRRAHWSMPECPEGCSSPSQSTHYRRQHRKPVECYSRSRGPASRGCDV